MPRILTAPAKLARYEREEDSTTGNTRENIYSKIIIQQNYNGRPLRL